MLLKYSFFSLAILKLVNGQAAQLYSNFGGNLMKCEDPLQDQSSLTRNWQARCGSQYFNPEYGVCCPAGVSWHNAGENYTNVGCCGGPVATACTKQKSVCCNVGDSVVVVPIDTTSEDINVDNLDCCGTSLIDKTKTKCCKGVIMNIATFCAATDAAPPQFYNNQYGQGYPRPGMYGQGGQQPYRPQPYGYPGGYNGYPNYPPPPQQLGAGGEPVAPQQFNGVIGGLSQEKMQPTVKPKPAGVGAVNGVGGIVSAAARSEDDIESALGK